jgi:hypothetical protein
MRVAVTTIGLATNGHSHLGVPVAQICTEPEALELPDGARLTDLVQLVGFSARDLDMAIVNGMHVTGDAPLRHGDCVALCGHVSGC